MRCQYCDIAFAQPNPNCRGCGAPKCAGRDTQMAKVPHPTLRDRLLVSIFERKWLTGQTILAIFFGTPFIFLAVIFYALGV